jgi:flagellar biogenesis protein FliO
MIRLHLLISILEWLGVEVICSMRPGSEVRRKLVLVVGVRGQVVVVVVVGSKLVVGVRGQVVVVEMV